MPSQDGSLTCLKTFPQLTIVRRFDLMDLRGACALSSIGATVNLLNNALSF